MKLITSRRTVVEKMVRRQTRKMGLSEYACAFGEAQAVESLKQGTSAFRAIQEGIAAAESKRLMLVVNNANNAA